jgi:adenylate cyclase
MSDGWAFDRLAARRAILFADLVESVRLFEQQEALTFERWRRYLDEVRGRIGPAHGVLLLRMAGDGMLMAFASASEATRAAFDLHQAITQANEGFDAASAFALRVGLHVAEVVANSDDLMGAGVNTAQRLSTLAQPGATVASAAFRAELGDGVQADIQDMGERVVKHLVEPVRAFALAPPGAGPATRLPSTEDLRPAVAVVPFVALPADPEHDALGHAMADDIIASLSRHPGLRVLSRASTAVVRGQALALPRLRELLGASFLLTGQFYVRGAKVRLNAELCELREGQVLWAGSVGGEVDALFEGQDELVPHLVAQVCQQVLAHELARVRSLPMDSLASYSLLLGARGLLHSLVKSDLGRSREVLEHLSERHPRQAAPDATLSEWQIINASQGGAEDTAQAVNRAYDYAQRALEKDPDHPDALIASGVASSFKHGDYAGAGRLYRKALQHDPNNARALARLSESHSEAGEHEWALETVTRAIALSPLDPERPFYECAAARAAYMMERWDLAIHHARNSMRLNALHAPSHRHLIAALWRSGRQEAARTAAANYVQLLPAAGVGATRETSREALLRSPFVQVLVEAGVPL